jgi:hypothetical protein
VAINLEDWWTIDTDCFKAVREVAIARIARRRCDIRIVRKVIVEIMLLILVQSKVLLLALEGSSFDVGKLKRRWVYEEVEVKLEKFLTSEVARVSKLATASFPISQLRGIECTAQPRRCHKLKTC